MTLSIIVPAYNKPENLRTCLKAISNSDKKPTEVIVVDDASKVPIKHIVKEFNYRYLRLKKNGGQAVARNAGAKISKSKILLFVDSDVAIRKNTISKVTNAFKNKKISVYQGIASKTPLNKGFGPKLMALKWFYMLKDIKKATFVHSHIFSIRKKVFDEIGRFDPRFKPPGCGEEFELGHRLRKKYTLYTDNTLLVEHKFQKVIPRMITLFHRTYVWTALFSKSGKFEHANASFKEALIGVLDTLTLFSVFLLFINLKFIYLILILFIIQSIMNMGFYIFILKESGLFFLIRAIIPNMLWSITQIAGASIFYMQRLLGLNNKVII